MKTNLISILLLAGVVYLVACKKDIDDNTPPENGHLDNELLAALEANSNGEGPAYFTLPASDDYANIPQDPNNPITAAKVNLGKFLFHETGIAKNPRLFTSSEEFSCASCHHAAAGFQSGIAQGIGEGGMGFGFAGEGRTVHPEYFDSPIWKDSVDVQAIRSPSVLNVAFQTNMLWNGQFGATGVNEGTDRLWTEGTPLTFNNLGFEGVETQAIAAQTVHRQQVDQEFCQEYSEYMTLFEQAFGTVPESIDELRINAGLAIAAYERTMLANEAPFQHWLKGSRNALSDMEKRGALLFFGKAECVTCHTGPALNSMEFHAYGMNDLYMRPDVIIATPVSMENVGRAAFTKDPADLFQFKVPQLYNMRDARILGHGASFDGVREVVEYKNAGLPQHPHLTAAEMSDKFTPLFLTQAEVDDLVSFLENALHDPALERYVPTELPTGMCFPNADTQSMIDLGCAE
ncbi:MAG: cytochrome-c peroxidase [Cryomorphaceae bacterium]